MKQANDQVKSVNSSNKKTKRVGAQNNQEVREASSNSNVATNSATNPVQTSSVSDAQAKSEIDKIKAGLEEQIKRYKSEIEQLRAELEDTKNKMLHALADYQNLARDLDRERAMNIFIAKKEVFKDLIELFSDLFLGLSHLADDIKNSPDIKGIFLIMEKYRGILSKHGIVEITFKEGDALDSNKAQVLGFIKTNKKELENKIAQVAEPGYGTIEYVIAPAKVFVYKFDTAPAS